MTVLHARVDTFFCLCRFVKRWFFSNKSYIGYSLGDRRNAARYA